MRRTTLSWPFGLTQLPLLVLQTHRQLLEPKRRLISFSSSSWDSPLLFPQPILRPLPWVAANINYTQSIGYSHYHGLQSKLQRRFANGLQSLVSYTWSKSTDVGSGYFNVENGPGGGTTVQNYYDMKTARGVSSYD